MATYPTLDPELNILDSHRQPNPYGVNMNVSHAIYPNLNVIYKPKNYVSPYTLENIQDSPMFNGSSARFAYRKRTGRPRKHRPLHAGHAGHAESFEIAKRRKEMAPENFVDPRHTDHVKPVAMPTRLKDERDSSKSEFLCLELIKKLAQKHGQQRNTSGCSEYGREDDIFCLSSRTCSGDYTRPGHEKLLYDDPFRARDLVEHVHDDHSYRNLNSLKYFGPRSVPQTKASPVIVGCYSLANSKVDSKVPLDRANHASNGFSENNSPMQLHDNRTHCALTYPPSSMSSKQNNHLDQNCVLCHQLATTTMIQPCYNPANEHKVSPIPRDHQARVIPALPVLPVLENHPTHLTESRSPRKMQDRKTLRETDDTSTFEAAIEKRIEKDFYETYHSKYYKAKLTEKYHEGKTKMSTVEMDEHVQNNFSRRNIYNEDREKRSQNGGNDFNTHLTAIPAIKNAESDLTRKWKVSSEEVISQLNTWETPSPEKDEGSPIETRYKTMDIDACFPENPERFVVVEKVEKTWNTSYKECSQDSIEHDSTTKGHTCYHCGRVFTHLSSLNNHTRTHTGQKPFRCRYCGKCFAQSGVLTAHLRTHTGDRPFECSHCKKRFAQTTTLANHIRTHTGQKPFSCKFCKRTFAQSSTRNKHQFSHTKRKPYKCKFCGRGFGQSATATRHMKVHMTQKAFPCVHCGKEFPYFHSLDKHLDSHNRS